MRACRNPRDEAEHVAATARELARMRGWRYRDMAVACQDESVYAPFSVVGCLYLLVQGVLRRREEPEALPEEIS